jgi:hypothetical protein
MALAGFSSINFAATLRNINSQAGVSPRVALATPRHKYTFLIEMQLNQYALIDAQTNVSQYINNGQIYGQLKSIDYPKPRFEIETLRSYNRYRKIYKRYHYDPATIVWHDDSTSMVMALMKEYLNFYYEIGNINTLGAGGAAFDDSQMNLEVGIVGDGVRTQMGTRQSLGQKVRPQSMRHFFEYITIYDLGTEPTSVNTHTFHRPVVAAFEHDNLDWYSAELISTPWILEYENYYFTIGQSVDNFTNVLNLVLGGSSNS